MFYGHIRVIYDPYSQLLIYSFPVLIKILSFHLVLTTQANLVFRHSRSIGHGMAILPCHHFDIQQPQNVLDYGENPYFHHVFAGTMCSYIFSQLSQLLKDFCRLLNSGLHCARNMICHEEVKGMD